MTDREMFPLIKKKCSSEGLTAGAEEAVSVELKLSRQKGPVVPSTAAHARSLYLGS